MPRQEVRRGRDARGCSTRPWPGNVRELRNAVERLLILAPGQGGHGRRRRPPAARRRRRGGPRRRRPARRQTFETFKQEAEKSFLAAEAAGARLERLGDGARAQDAPLEPVQEDRALRPDPGVGMTEQPRDWDKELADDRQGDRQAGKAAAPARPRRAPGRRRRAASPRRGRLAQAVGRAHLVLGPARAARLAVGAAALALRAAPAGSSSSSILGAAAIALLAGCARRRGAAGRSRRGFAHLLSLLVVARRALVLACARGAAADRLRAQDRRPGSAPRRRRPRRQLHLRPHRLPTTPDLRTHVLHGQDLQELHRR